MLLPRRPPCPGDWLARQLRPFCEAKLTPSPLSFPEVVMTGLAHDRGLFVPDTIPTVTPAELEAWRSLPYDQLSYKVMSKFICPDQIPTASLQSIITTACKSFRHSDVTPVKDVNGHYVLELFWGPTFAFKDVALQVRGDDGPQGRVGRGARSGRSCAKSQGGACEQRRGRAAAE